MHLRGDTPNPRATGAQSAREALLCSLAAGRLCASDYSARWVGRGSPIVRGTEYGLAGETTACSARAVTGDSGMVDRNDVSLSRRVGGDPSRPKWPGRFARLGKRSCTLCRSGPRLAAGDRKALASNCRERIAREGPRVFGHSRRGRPPGHRAQSTLPLGILFAAKNDFAELAACPGAPLRHELHHHPRADAPSRDEPLDPVLETGGTGLPRILDGQTMAERPRGAAPMNSCIHAPRDRHGVSSTGRLTQRRKGRKVNSGEGIVLRSAPSFR